MKSTLIPTKTLTPTTLTDAQRTNISETIIDRYLDGMSSRDLEQFFRDIQSQYLQEYTDEELRDALRDLLDEEEYNEAINCEL